MPAVRQQQPPPTSKKPPAKKPPPAPEGGILDQIEPISVPSVGLKIAVFGKSGSGKTTFACTFPKPLLLIGAEDGRRSVYRDAGIEYVALRDCDDLRTLVGAQRDGTFPESLQKRIDADRFQSVVLDSVTFFQDLVIKKVLNVSELPPQLSWGTLSQSQWGDVGLGVKDMMREFLDLTCHAVVVAQEREFNNEGTGEVLAPYVNCAVSPSVVGWLGPAVEYLTQAFLRTGKVKVKEKLAATGQMVEKDKEIVEFCLRTGQHPVYSTKFRRPRGSKTPIPDAIVDPTFDKLMAVIESP